MKSIRQPLFVAAGSVAAWICVGTLAFRTMEGWSWVDSFYFSVATLSTVGYGDLYPTTDISKLFTSFYIILGVAVVFASLGFLGAKYLESETRLLTRRLKHKPKRSRR